LGWKYSLLAALMFEELYLVLLELIFVTGALRLIFGRGDAEWGHVAPSTQHLVTDDARILPEAA
jgi:hypothetical protein